MEVTETYYQIDKKKYGPRIKRDASSTCFEAYTVSKNDFKKPLPFVCDRFRVGIGGKFLVVIPINNNGKDAVVLKNIKDGETIDLSIVAIVNTDCKNIVIMK